MTTYAPVTIQQAQFPIIESFTHDTVTNPHWQLLGSTQLNGGS